MRTPKEGIENEAETDKKVDEVRKAALFFMHLYMRTSKIPHLREAAFPFAEVTGTKSQDEGGNGAAPGPRPGLRVFSWLSHLPILRGQPEGCFQNTGLTYPFQAERWPLALHHPRDHGFFFFAEF